MDGLLQLRAILCRLTRLEIQTGQYWRWESHTQLAATEYQGSGGLPGEENSVPLVLDKTSAM